jgi:hypothetical protein
LRLLGLGILCAALACRSPLSPDELSRLAANERRWAGRGFADYSIETLSSCFCAPDVTSWTRIEVIGGQVRRATRLATGEVITDARLSYWSSVEALFASIHDAKRDGFLEDIRVRYDAALGFPTLVEWIPAKGVLDAGGSRILRNAQPLP